MAEERNLRILLTNEGWHLLQKYKKTQKLFFTSDSFHSVPNTKTLIIFLYLCAYYQTIFTM